MGGRDKAGERGSGEGGGSGARVEGGARREVLGLEKGGGPTIGDTGRGSRSRRCIVYVMQCMPVIL